MALTRAKLTKVKRQVRAQTMLLHIAAMNLIHRGHSGNSMFLAVMLSLTGVLIVSWTISMR